jgi:hypothetical protein
MQVDPTAAHLYITPWTVLPCCWTTGAAAVTCHCATFLLTCALCNWAVTVACVCKDELWLQLREAIFSKGALRAKSSD